MEDFIPYELAVKLKEKGFNEPCFGWYYATPTCQFDHKENIVFNHSQLRGATYDDLLLPSQGDNINAPTISQALKWLRKEKNVVFGISPMQEMDCDYLGWCVTIYKVADDGYGLSWQEELYYDSYESAVLAGIKYVLDNLI